MSAIRETTRPEASPRRARIRSPRPALRSRGLLASVVLVLAMTLSSSDASSAYWSVGGSGSGSSTTGTLLPPTAVVVPPTSGPDVAVGWTPSAGTPAPIGYYVTRISAGVSAAACGSSEAVLVPDASCTDAAVVDGDYSYVVTAVYRTWTATGSASGTVLVRFEAVAQVGGSRTEVSP